MATSGSITADICGNNPDISNNIIFSQKLRSQSGNNSFKNNINWTRDNEGSYNAFANGQSILRRTLNYTAKNTSDEVIKTRQPMSSSELIKIRQLRSQTPRLPAVVYQPISLSSNPEIATAIAADGQVASIDPSGNNCWYYKNVNPQKINWYFYADITGSENNIINDLRFFYFVVEIRNTNVSNKPWIVLYTAPEGVGDYAPWFRSLYNYGGYFLSGVSQTTGKYVYYVGNLQTALLDDSVKLLPKINLGSYTPITLGPQGINEKMLYIAIHSDSSEGSGGFDFCISEVGYKFGTKSQVTIQTTN